MTRPSHAPAAKANAPRCPVCSTPLQKGACPTHGAPFGDDERTSTEDLTGLWEPTNTRDILLGKKIGEYVVQRRIGDGGMGLVYEGLQPLIGRRVAIKILRPDYVESSAQIRGLLAEARAANAVRHRGIIDIFGFGELPGVGQYIVMEYLDGRPLDAVLSERGTLPPGEIVSILDEALAALGAAHGRGVIHRDLKPSNIFLCNDAGGTYVKVLDFGLAKHSTVGLPAAQSRVSQIVGTPHYMAPEQAQSRPVSAATDLYAIGVIAFEMITGRLPFEAKTPVEMLVAHINNPPPRPSLCAPNVPPELETLILKLLEKAPEDRPPSASAVRDELRQLAMTLRPSDMPALRARSGQLGDEIEPTSRSVRKAAVGSTPDRRRPAALIAGAVGVLAAAALGFLVLRPTAPAPDDAQRRAKDLELLSSPASDPAPKPVEVERPTAVQKPSEDELAPPPLELKPKPAPFVRKAAAAPEVAKPAAPVKPARATATGHLHITLRGAGQVWVDGHLEGNIPPKNDLDLPAGAHAIEILSPVAKPFRAEVQISADAPVELKAVLTPLQ